MPRRRPFRGLALVLAALPGCYDGADPLDPQLLAEIARSRGDAEGISLSGFYRGEFEKIDCGCEDIPRAQQASLCTLIDNAGLFGMGGLFAVEVVQADGTLRIRPEVQDLLSGEFLAPTLYGPVSAEGDVVVAGVLRADALLVQGQVLGRADGTLTGPPGASVLEVDYQQRSTLDVITSDGGPDREISNGVETIDCRERIAMDLTWFEGLPGPE